LSFVDVVFIFTGLSIQFVMRIKRKRVVRYWKWPESIDLSSCFLDVCHWTLICSSLGKNNSSS